MTIARTDSGRGRGPNSPFDAIRTVEEDSDGNEFEYWSARAAQEPLGYANWQNMESVIRRARSACRNAGCDPGQHFTDVSKSFDMPNGARRQSSDVQMTRFGMYLLAMNGDPDKPEIAAAQRYFAVQTYRAEQLLPPPTPQPIAPPPEPPPVEFRPWAERFRETFGRHQRHVFTNFPQGSFTVITAGVMPMLMLEDQLIRHMMEVRVGDRPCVSIGLTWSNYRRRQGWGEAIGHAPVYLPDVDLEVEACVYPASEMAAFHVWLNFTYLPSKLLNYLDGKPEFKSAGALPRASAADNTCRDMTGYPALLPGGLSRQLVAAGGFVPAPRQLPPGTPRQLPPKV